MSRPLRDAQLDARDASLDIVRIARSAEALGARNRRSKLTSIGSQTGIVSSPAGGSQIRRAGCLPGWISTLRPN